MENLRYKKLLMDLNAWNRIDDSETMNKIVNSYDTISLSINISWHEWAVIDYGKGMKLEEFIEKQKDLQNWLYVSEDLSNILKMQEYHIACCFVNTGINDCIDVSYAHEIRDVSVLQKVFK